MQAKKKEQGIISSLQRPGFYSLHPRLPSMYFSRTPKHLYIKTSGTSVETRAFSHLRVTARFHTWQAFIPQRYQNMGSTLASGHWLNTPRIPMKTCGLQPCSENCYCILKTISTCSFFSSNEHIEHTWTSRESESKLAAQSWFPKIKMIHF